MRTVPRNHITDCRNYLREYVSVLPEVAFGRAMLLLVSASIVDTGDLRGGDAAEQVIEYGESVTYEVTPPKGTDLPRELSQATGRYRVDRPFVATVRDARLVSPGPIALTADGDAVTATVGGCRRGLYDALGTIILERGYLRGSTHLTTPVFGEYDAAFPMVSPHDNYFSWVTGYLPQLRALEEYRRRTGRSPEVLVADDPPAWTHETLRLATRETDWVEWDEECSSVDRLVVPGHPPRSSTMFTPLLPDLRWVRDRILDAVDSSPARFPDRVVLTYEDGIRVRNRSSLVDALSERDVHPVAAGELSTSERVSLFAGADVVVGPQREQLADVVFGSDLGLVELAPADDVQPYTFVLADLLGHSYEYVEGSASDGDAFAVDEDAVVASVDRLVG